MSALHDSFRDLRPDATLDLVERMPGGASNRTYDRVHWHTSGARGTYVVMGLADEPLRSEEASSGPVIDELPFLTMQRFLTAQGVQVPAIHRVDLARNVIWLDDLGDTMLRDALSAEGADRLTLYRSAIEVLVAFQRATGDRPEPAPVCYHRRFEPALLRWELDHYREWRLEAHLGLVLPEPTRATLDRAFDDLVEHLVRLPSVVCHRDFQSTNLMVTPDGLVLLDFQDALLGPLPYDLVSLLRDSYVVLAPREVDTLVDAYLEARPDLDRVAYRRAFHLQTVQRKLKDSGRFVYIDRVKMNPRYLPNIAPSLGYVRHALRQVPELEELAGILAELDPQLAS